VRAAVVGVSVAAAVGGIVAVAAVVGGDPADESPTGTRSCPQLDPVGRDQAEIVPAPAGTIPAAYTVEVVGRNPHDRGAFTQGLLHAGGLLYEGTGEYGASRIRLVEPESGDVLAEQSLPESMFGEGVAGHDGRLFQLTWREEEVLVRDRCTLREVERLTYDGEGWGLTGDGRLLWRSDGSSTLSAHDPDTFAEMRTVDVRDRGVPLDLLNELELVDGRILANVWKTPWIAQIDPTTGEVTGWIDASPLVDEVGSSDPEDVLNGIAVDGESGLLWLTGKRWPTMFEVRVVPGAELPVPGVDG
jgi:glutaminyl-peptide cyclotransferase